MNKIVYSSNVSMPLDVERVGQFCKSDPKSHEYFVSNVPNKGEVKIAVSKLSSIAQASYDRQRGGLTFVTKAISPDSKKEEAVARKVIETILEICG